MQTGSEEVDGASMQLEADEMGSSLGSTCNESSAGALNTSNAEMAIKDVNGGAQVFATFTRELPQSVMQTIHGMVSQQKQRALTVEEKKEQCSKKPDKLIPCPRCDSLETKFCYYNNYNVNQPRHFCKSCQRYWTAGGTLRNVLVGAGRRKNKYGASQMKQEDAEGANSGITTVRMDHHEGAQPMLPCTINPYVIKVPPMQLPQLATQCSPRQVSDVQSTVTTSCKAVSSASAFQPAVPEMSTDSVSKLRQRSGTESTFEGKETSSSISSVSATETTSKYVLSSRVPPQQQADQQAVWTKNSVPLGYFNGAWPYGYNIGIGGVGPIPDNPAMCGPHPAAALTSSNLPNGMSPPPVNVWTGMWASGMPSGMPGMAGVPAVPFGWNVCQGGWTLPWRPVPAVAVQPPAEVMHSGSARKWDSASSEDRVRKMARVEIPEKDVL